MQIVELRAPLWMYTPKGKARALFLRDNGDEDNCEWGCVICDGAHTGEIWWVANPDVRMLKNWTLKRGDPARKVHQDTVTRDQSERPLNGHTNDMAAT